MLPNVSEASAVSEAAVFSAVQSVVRVIAKDPSTTCSGESDLFTDLGLSSLSVVMLLTEVCEQLNFNIFNYSESDLNDVKTVRDLVALLSAKR